jgi:hypothetical protein
MDTPGKRDTVNLCGTAMHGDVHRQDATNCPLFPATPEFVDRWSFLTVFPVAAPSAKSAVLFRLLNNSDGKNCGWRGYFG